LATWREMSLDSRRAAQEALTAGRLRSSISRSYYASYCAVTSRLSGRFTFDYSGNNPAHSDLPNLIFYNLNVVDESVRRDIRKAVAQLWKARIEADYVPTAYIDRDIALNALRDASRVLRLLEIKDE